MIHLREGNGRLGNNLFRSLVANHISEKTGAAVKYYCDFSELGLQLNRGATWPTQDTIRSLESVRFNENYFEEDHDFTELIGKNIELQHNYCQTPFTANLIINHLKKNQSIIENHNPYKNRYNTNNDVYIHVRLGDVTQNNPGIKYYSTVLDSLNFTNGYISSDNINHPLCKELIQNYRLQVLFMTEIKTWQFASTCKYLVLSNGTFSWAVGALGFYSSVYYPQIKKQWHGNIFNKELWNEIEF